MAIDEGKQNGKGLQLEQVNENQVEASLWKQRVRLNLSVGATDLLAKKKRASVMMNNQIYEIIPNTKEALQFRGKRLLLDEKIAKKIDRLLKQSSKEPKKEVMQTA